MSNLERLACLLARRNGYFLTVGRAPMLGLRSGGVSFGRLDSRMRDFQGHTRQWPRPEAEDYIQVVC